MIYFIYSPNERPLIQPLADALGEEYTVKLAPVGLEAGSPEWQKIVEADIKSSQAVIVGVTQHALQDETFTWRFNLAQNAKKLIIPINYDEPSPTNEAGSMRPGPVLTPLKNYNILPAKPLVMYQTFSATPELDMLLLKVREALADKVDKKPKEYRLFISYARTDSDFAQRLTQDLRDAGIETWRDAENIPKGANWDREIQKAIENCTHVIFIATPDSVKSENVQDELSLAINKQKIIIPVMLQTCELPLRVHRAQWVDFREEYRFGIKNLLDHFDLDYVPDDVYKSHLDRLFSDALTVMDELATSNKDKFTSQEFLKRIARDYALIYLDLLNSTRNYLTKTKGEVYAGKWVFRLAHQSIGRRLSQVAQKNGYELVKGGRDEMDIFGNPTQRNTYRKR